MMSGLILILLACIILAYALGRHYGFEEGIKIARMWEAHYRLVCPKSSNEEIDELKKMWKR